MKNVKPESDKWFLYHEGIDLLYERVEGYPMDRFMQGKGNLFYWQCKPCHKLDRHASKYQNTF